MLSDDAVGLETAARALREGRLVAIPTETVYGLGANARDEQALARIFAAKQRPFFDPLIIHVADMAAADEVADFSRPYARQLAEAFWPGPLTLVLPKRDWVPALATSDLPTVAVRCPGLELTRRLIALAGVPVAAPSANLFGHLSPTTAAHVAEGLGNSVDYILDGGSCTLGVESTVLDLSMDPPLILRPGGLSLEELRRIVPTVELFDRATTSPRAPGQLPNHYAPRKPLRLFAAGELAALVGGRVEVVGPAGTDDQVRTVADALVPRVVPPYTAALAFGREVCAGLRASGLFSEVRDLSPGADVLEAAASLFVLLHELEVGGCERIWAERVPEVGIGRAVNDRLFKASDKEADTHA
ncbi:MAG: threonylcarbamoyl-AMP synthase [Spirochaetes bacterium]|nr:threonylcarbamoyl-AMP synthase [Spirochaetota bacterium]MBU0956841.1 threonylcarbamoyl-AMP synthase [Spirochaetota bacterium]